MELLLDPIIIEGELPFHINRKKNGGIINQNGVNNHFELPSTNYIDILIVLFIIIVFVVLIWKYTFTNQTKINKIEI